MIKKLEKMCKMQAKLDEAIYAGHNATYNADKNYLALCDEVGELIHELKPEWCWWKNCEPTDKSKVLGELVDVWHFAMSRYNHDPNNSPIEVEIAAYEMMKGAPRRFNTIIQVLHIQRQIYILGIMLELTEALGFSLDDVYKGYLEKNKVNYERLENGY